MFRRGTAGFRLAACSAFFFVLLTPLRSHDPITTKLTWAREISRIVYRRCAGCHHSGGQAVDLTSYEAARPWAKAIRDEILSRRMPPWGAVKGVRDFLGDPSLSQPETGMLIAWVEGGAPEGETKDLPPRLPQFRTESPALPRHSGALAVTNQTTLRRAATLVALRPRDLPDGGSLEAWALKPDGAVDRLIWLTDYRKAWTRDYVLVMPLALPSGTRLRVAANTGSLIVYFR